MSEASAEGAAQGLGQGGAALQVGALPGVVLLNLQRRGLGPMPRRR